MKAAAYNLAIETSGRHGAVALGRGEELLAARKLTAPEGRRHDVGLTPGIDAVCREFGVEPGSIGEVYVSLGPGSFTGLRVGITTAKMLAYALGARVVGVPTLEVLAEGVLGAWDEREAWGGRGHPLPAPPKGRGVGRVAVGLNAKRGTVYSGVFGRENGKRVTEVGAGLRTWGELLAEAGRPVAVVAEKPPLPEEIEGFPGVTVLGGEWAVARPEVVWRIGREMAGRGAFADVATLRPLYAREPEAVTLWDERERREKERAAAPHPLNG